MGGLHCRCAREPGSNRVILPTSGPRVRKSLNFTFSPNDKGGMYAMCMWLHLRDAISEGAFLVQSLKFYVVRGFHQRKILDASTVQFQKFMIIL